MMNNNNPIGKIRWTVCSLLFFATTVNYLDRAVISLLKQPLSKELGWDDGDYANIEIAFKASYAIGMLIAGRVIDKLGTKIGYALATGLWSIAAVCHALVSSVFGFSMVRAFLGITEAGNFPAAIKTTAEWFPQKERALATGIFNSGANVGAIVAPLSVPFIAEYMGWQWAFIITGAIGFVWLVCWMLWYEIPERHQQLSQTELDYIKSDDIATNATESNTDKYSWLQLLGYKQTWGFAVGKLLTDPIWWFYLFWLPDFLQSQYQLKGTQVALPVAVVYLMSTFGSIAGGWLPLQLIKKGWQAFGARKTSMLLYAIAVLPILFAQVLGGINMWLAVIVIGIAASAHQAWSANIFSTVSDFFPAKAVASVTGIGGMFGAAGGIFLSLFVQKQLFVQYRAAGNIEQAYYIMFAICGLAYLLAWLLMFLLFNKKGVAKNPGLKKV
jgi:MFS transporter, ACS family, hexuronate transporter